MKDTHTTSPALETRGLTKTYGAGNTQVIAMQDVHLKVERGEVVALLGPSGSGKSTFLISVGLIQAPSSGQVWIGGTLVQDGSRALLNQRAFRRAHIGFVFQKSNLIPFLNARENVQVALELNRMPSRKARSRAMELLADLGVGDRSEHFPSQLSGGQQQRVAVARAIANNPELILADEPTAALDSHRGRQVMQLFKQIAHDRGSAAIVVTHDQRALDVFDRIYEMEDGRIREDPGAGQTARGP